MTSLILIYCRFGVVSHRETMAGTPQYALLTLCSYSVHQYWSIRPWFALRFTMLVVATYGFSGSQQAKIWSVLWALHVLLSQYCICFIAMADCRSDRSNHIQRHLGLCPLITLLEILKMYLEVPDLWSLAMSGLQLVWVNKETSGLLVGNFYHNRGENIIYSLSSGTLVV